MFRKSLLVFFHLAIGTISLVYGDFPANNVVVLSTDSTKYNRYTYIDIEKSKYENLEFVTDISGRNLRYELSVMGSGSTSTGDGGSVGGGVRIFEKRSFLAENVKAYYIVGNEYYLLPGGDSLTIVTKEGQNSEFIETKTFSALDSSKTTQNWKNFHILPKAYLSFNPLSGAWKNASFTLVTTPILSIGTLSSIEAAKENNPVSLQRNGNEYSYPVVTEGTYIIKFKTVDSNQQAITTDYEVKLDMSPPVISLTNTPHTGGWSCNITDQWSGVETNSYKIAYSPVIVQNVTPESFLGLDPVIGPVNLLSVATISIPNANWGDGFYYLLIESRDRAGNIATKVSEPSLIDTHGPNLEQPEAVISPDSTNIVISWNPATDPFSGLNEGTGAYECVYSLSSSFTQETPCGQISQVGMSLSSTLAISDNLRGQHVYFKVKVSDKAGNNTVRELDLFIPQKIILTAELNSENTTSSLMVVDLGFNLSPSAVKSSFASLRITRQADDSVLEELNLESNSIILDSNGDLIASGGWYLNNLGKLIYRDEILVSSGFGHKNLKYTLYTTPAMGGEPMVKALDLPNHPGEITQIKVLDGLGRSSDSPDFKIGSDGLIQLVFEGFDMDLDPWLLEVDSVNQLGTGPSAIKTYSTRKDASEYRHENKKYVGNIPLKLFIGINNLSLVWIEKGNQSERFYSQIKSITLVKDGQGNFSITITDGFTQPVSQKENGIIVRPGQPITFSVNAPGANQSDFVWDFGNGNSLTGTEVTYAYPQNPNQTQDFSFYSLGLTVIGNLPLTLGVAVQDTREGTLYVDEVWRGDHLVTGQIVIPVGMQITVPGGDGTKIRFKGGLGAGFNQGFLVSGTMTIGDGVLLEKDPSQAQGWGTVMVNGNLTVGRSEIKDGDRGVTAAPGSLVTLNGTKLIKNLTGVHVVGNNLVELRDCELSGGIYGIKEDSGGLPKLIGCLFFDNIRNYYSALQGLLTIEEINAQVGSMGNVGK